MKKLGVWLKKTVPDYAVIPLIVWFSLNALAFWGARWINRYAVYHDFTLPFDRSIPFIPAFIVIYTLAFATWFAGFILICRQSPAHCGILFSEIAAKVICFIIFITVPTCMDKPPADGKDFFSWMCRFIFSFDEPNTLFPSIHCLENWMIWRGMFGCKGISKPVKAFFGVYMVLVFASTLLVKQHVLVDIPSAIVVGEIGLFLGRKLRLGERYAERLRIREASA